MSTNRAAWHRRAGLIPLAYLAAIVPASFGHAFLPHGPWLLKHLLFLGAVTNAIVVWGTHFTSAILHSPPPATRQAETIRLVVLNAGVVGVIAGGSSAPWLDQHSSGAWLGITGGAWLGLAGATAVFAAVAAHLAALARQLRRALPARFSITVRYYLAAGIALLAGIPAGAWMLTVDDGSRPRLLLFHAHANLLGFVTLTVLGTLLTLWPTVLRTRMVDGANRAATLALPLCLAGLASLGAGTLAWWPALTAAGLALFGAAVAILAVPAVKTARQCPPASFATWSMAAAGGWLVVTLVVDAVTLLAADNAAEAASRFSAVLVPLGGGFVAQVLLGALSYLLPMALGGGPALVRKRTSLLDAHWPQRVTMANLALVGYLLPVPPYVRIAVALLGLAALIQFLVPVIRILLPQRKGASADSAQAGPATTRPAAPKAVTAGAPRPLGGIAAGVALMLLAVLAGTAVQRADNESAAADTRTVPPTGHTTTVEVAAVGMRYQPDRISVPAGDRLVIVLTNTDSRRHDLVLSNGARTRLLAKGASERLDAGIIGGTVQGWCTQPAHRQAGMKLTITTTGGTGDATTGPAHTDPAHTDPAPTVDAAADPGPGFTARDATAPALAPAATGQVHRLTLRAQEVRRDIAPGVSQTLWTFNGTAPGPVLRGRLGDIFEITLINDTDIEHGLDFHAEALAPDTAMRTIERGETAVLRFTAVRAGIWMYHCSAMPLLYHVGNGMYGALIIDPPDLAPVDREYVLVQSEFYLGGHGQRGDADKMAADQPDAIVFNGYVSQYAHRPLTARAGERVRIWLLDAGPNRSSAFHVVGAPFDTVYVEGAYRLRPPDPGGAQVLDLAPASGGFAEMVFTQPGNYPFLTHSLADADRGARGTVRVSAK